jgi:hypothetical protein
LYLTFSIHTWWNGAAGGLYDYNFVRLIACCYHDRRGFSTRDANVQINSIRAKTG